MPDVKPIMIIKTGTMKRREINRAEKNGVCVLESDDPSAMRMLDLPLVTASLPAQAQASIKLMRAIVETKPHCTLDRDAFVQLFVQALIGYQEPPAVEHVKKVGK